MLASGYMDEQKQQETKRFSLYTSRDLLERLRSAAQKNHRSVNGEMLHAIEQYLTQQEKQ